MKDKFIKKIIEIFDYSNSKISIYIDIIVVLTTYFITKLFGGNVTITILICITSILAIGSLVQILRKDRDTKMIASYLLGTLFLLFVTIMSYLINKYSSADSHAMLADVIKFSICTMALIFDIPGVFYITNKENQRNKKLILLACMISFSLCAIVVVTFFASIGL